jgi:hypothetical protein
MIRTLTNLSGLLMIILTACNPVVRAKKGKLGSFKVKATADGLKQGITGILVK